MSLKSQVKQQRQLVQDTESALEDLKTPPKYAPVGNQIFDYMTSLLEQEQIEEKRLLRLQQLEAALEPAKAELERLESELKETTKLSDKGTKEALALIDRFNQIEQQRVAQLSEIARQLQKLQHDCSDAWQEIEGKALVKVPQDIDRYLREHTTTAYQFSDGRFELVASDRLKLLEEHARFRPLSA